MTICRAFYFDIRKDSLYCDAPTSPKRRAYRTVLDTLFHALVRWLSPVLVFTTEEVWGTRFPDAQSVHLLEWPEVPPARRRRRQMERSAPAANAGHRSDRAAAARESARLEPRSRGHAARASRVNHEFSTSCSSSPQSSRAMECVVTKTANHKCGRCWRYLPEVKGDGELCDRCDAL